MTIRLQHRSLSANEREILTLVRRLAPLTRADLVPLTGLTAQSVSRIVGALEKAGYLRALGRRRQARGQPGVVYDIDSQAGFSVGISLHREEITVALLDLKGTRITVADAPVIRNSLDELLQDAETLVRETVRAAGLVGSDSIGVGLSVPGYFLPGGQRIVPPPPMVYLAEYDLSDAFATQLGARVWLENDGSAAAIGESLLGTETGTGYGDFLYVFLDYGVGGGLILDGRLRRGAFGNAAELGLLIPPQPQPRPSLEYLFHLFREAGITMENIHDLRAFQNPAHPVFEEWLVIARNHVDTFCRAATAVVNPERFVLGGRVPVFLLERLAEKIAPPGGSRRGYLAERPKVVASQLGFEATVFGAASLPLKALLYA